MTTRDISLVALMAAVIVALGVVPAIPLAGGVPITLQSMGVMLAGLVLGPRRGAAAVLVVIALVALGLPVLAGGRGGLAVFAGPTAGFLLGWVLAAFVTGFLAQVFEAPEKSTPVRTLQLTLAAIVGGIVVLYLCGILWLAFFMKMGLAKAFAVSIAFVPGDVAKAVVAALVTVQVRRAVAIERK
ncbi:MAG: biotin transporter BioY [Siculibacillus sp.]|nr:biotin transporter BioY [Siculibacillus sp.]